MYKKNIIKSDNIFNYKFRVRIPTGVHKNLSLYSSPSEKIDYYFLLELYIYFQIYAYK